MYYIDSHCHLYEEACSSVDVVYENAINNNVNKMFNVAEDYKSSVEIVNIVKKYNGNMYASVGIHPENIPSNIEEEVLKIEELIKNNKVISIGEIGLDYYWTKDTKEEQKKLFELQLNLAQKYNLPVIIHSREATEDTINILKKYNLKGIIHSFSGSLETAKIYIKMGYLLGINGVVTFKNCNLKEIIPSIDINHLVFETDSPFLTPVPYRGKVNEPANVRFVYKFVSEVLGIDEEKLMDTVISNIDRVFDI